MVCSLLDYGIFLLGVGFVVHRQKFFWRAKAKVVFHRKLDPLKEKLVAILVIETYISIFLYSMFQILSTIYQIKKNNFISIFHFVFGTLRFTFYPVRNGECHLRKIMQERHRKDQLLGRKGIEKIIIKAKIEGKC